MRYRYKGAPVTDLKKCREYINLRITQLVHIPHIVRWINYGIALCVRRKVKLADILNQKRGWDRGGRSVYITDLDERIVIALASQDKSAYWKISALCRSITAIDMLLTEERRKARS